jgi:hypothetical protein
MKTIKTIKISQIPTTAIKNTITPLAMPKAQL